MNLNMHITSQSFVQSYRRFERNSYVHTSSTSDTAGIGFPHHYSHSYFLSGIVAACPTENKDNIEELEFPCRENPTFSF